MSGESSRFLFAYGTLMTGECRFPLLESGSVESVESGYVFGTLFNLGSYPGLFLAENPESVPVLGELIEFKQLDEILCRLDDEEGSEYRRELIWATRADGSRQPAWCYVLATQPDSACPVIASGNWRDCSRRC